MKIAERMAAGGTMRVAITRHFDRRYNRRVGRASRRLQQILLEGLLAAGKSQPLGGRFHAVPLTQGQTAILAWQDGVWIAVTVRPLSCGGHRTP